MSRRCEALCTSVESGRGPDGKVQKPMWQCSNNARFEFAEKFYCGTHNPERRFQKALKKAIKNEPQ